MRVYVRTLPFHATKEEIEVALRALGLPVPTNIHIIRKGNLPNLVLVNLCFLGLVYQVGKHNCRKSCDLRQLCFPSRLLGNFTMVLGVLAIWTG